MMKDFVHILELKKLTQIDNPNCYYHSSSCVCCQGCIIVDNIAIDLIKQYEDKIDQSFTHIKGWEIGHTKGHVVLDDYNWHCINYCLQALTADIKRLNKELLNVPSWEELEKHSDLLLAQLAFSFLTQLKELDLKCTQCGSPILKYYT